MNSAYGRLEIKIYSNPEATTENAAIAAVSARRMRGPSVAAFHAFASNSASSAGAHPPSGPTAISSTGISSPAACTASSTSRRKSGCAFLLGQNNARCVGCCLDVRRQRSGLMNQRDIGTARLLGGLMRDAAPALRSLVCGLGQVLLSALRNNRGHGGDAELGRFLKWPTPCDRTCRPPSPALRAARDRLALR